jgi:HEAT repeat protein
LKNENSRARIAAALGLEWLGDSARAVTPEIAVALRAESDLEAQAGLVHALSRLDHDPKDLLDIVVPLLRSEAEAVRQEASNALILMEPAATTSVPVLRTMVRSDDQAAIKVGASFLGAIGPSAGDAVPDLVAVRTKTESGSELAAAIDESLVQIGSPSVPVLVKVMNDTGGDVDHWSVKCLRDLGPAAVPAMISALESENLDRQRDACQLLGLIGESAESAIPQLRRLAEAGANEIKGPALVALANAGGKPEVILPLAEQLLVSSAVEQRRAGAQALARLGAKAQPALQSLIAGLRDQDSSVAAESARALGQFGDGAAPAVEPLTAS